MADGGEPVRVDGQAEQFVFVGLERGGQLQALHVFFGQRIVGGADTELHGHVQAGGRLAAARYADQDQVGLVVVVGAGAVIVVEGEVDRLDALHVVAVAGDGVRLADRIGGMLAEFGLQRSQEGRKDVDHEAFGLGQDVANLLVDHGVEDDRPGAVLLRSMVDLLYHGPRLVDAVYVGACELGKADGLELRQQALPQSFRGDARAVGNEECGAFH